MKYKPGDDMSVLENLISGRYSCRAYRPEPLPKKLVIQILEAAQRTVSDCNIQPWQVYIISGERLEHIRTEMFRTASGGAGVVADIPPIPIYTGVFQERRRSCGWTLYSTLGIQKGDREGGTKQAMENFKFFDAPHLALITTHSSLGPRALLDCGGYLTSFLLAAQALGVGAVAQASIAQRADVFRKEMPLPDEHHIVCGIAFGWPDSGHLANAGRTSRATLNEAVTFLD